MALSRRDLEVFSTEKPDYVIPCLMAGLLARVLLIVNSFGTNDQIIWLNIGKWSNQSGLIQTYCSYTMMTHALPPSLWAKELYRIVGPACFPYFFKLPSLAADILTTALLLRSPRGRLAAAIFALSPIAILQSSFDGSTDSIYVALSFCAAYLLARKRFVAAGFVLGAAINVKFVPILLIPIGLSLCRRWREAAQFLWPLILWALPNVPLLLNPTIRSTMLHYISSQDRWGVLLLIELLGNHLHTGLRSSNQVEAYVLLGRWMIIAGVAALAVISFFKRRWDSFSLFLLTYLIFLVLAPGFGVQYCLIVVPFMIRFDVRLGWIYSLLAGVFVAVDYGGHLIDWHPIYVYVDARLSDAAALTGLAVWCLAAVSAKLVFSGKLGDAKDRSIELIRIESSGAVPA